MSIYPSSFWLRSKSLCGCIYYNGYSSLVYVGAYKLRRATSMVGLSLMANRRGLCFNITSIRIVRGILVTYSEHLYLQTNDGYSEYTEGIVWCSLT